MGLGESTHDTNKVTMEGLQQSMIAWLKSIERDPWFLALGSVVIVGLFLYYFYISFIRREQ